MTVMTMVAMTVVKPWFRFSLASPNRWNVGLLVERYGAAVVVDIRGVDNAGGQILLPLEEGGRGEVDAEQDGEEEQEGDQLHPDGGGLGELSRWSGKTGGL